ncbi:MAG: type IV secretion system protein [Acidobacteria bacterium]|nr:type IV secretion system protein [Acidobacteriota bacterium]
MPQLTPVTVPPGQEWDAKAFLDQVLQQLVGLAAPEFQTAGLAIWTGMATVMIVWTGLKTAFSGEYDLWEIVKLVIGLGIPRTMLAFYNTPVPGTTMSFPELITRQGTWATDVFIGNSWQNLQQTVLPAFSNIFTQITDSIRSFGAADVWIKGISFLIASLFGSLFMALMLVLLLLMFCLLMAQVIWAHFALAVAIMVGPILIPWLIFPPLSFLFWGWFRTLLTYTFYGVIAGAVFNVFMNVGLGFLNSLLTAVLTFEDLSGVFRWYLILWPLIIAGVLASLKVGELAQLLVSGAGSATAGLGTRVRQVAMAAKTGGASLAAGR